jgi:hypothetical protein
MVQCGGLFYILWLSCVPRVCQTSSILTLSIVSLAIDQKTDVTLLISRLPLSLDSNIDIFPYSPLALDETDFPVLQNEMEINKFSEIRALLPHDHETNCKAAEMFHESELLVQQKKLTKERHGPCLNQNHRLNMSPLLPKRLSHYQRLHMHCARNETLITLLMVSKHWS